ncbi:MAG: hypothetical protein DRI54_07250 [Bacteroidetes bacterium]|nr:MAG: hypothetical protein DRI54_07250 [Bacteroidota bacterium]
MKKFAFLFWFFLFQLSILNAQGDSTKAAEKAEKKAARVEKKADKVANGEFLITPFGAPGYAPELGGLIAIGAVMSFKTNKKDSLIQRSSLPATFTYTTTGAVVISGILKSYWFKDKLRINTDFYYKDMPDNYWGIGYENATTIPRSDSTTAYHRLWWVINPRFLYQFRKNYFVGLNIDYNFTQGSDPSEGVASDPNYIEYNDKPLNSGLGAILQFDSRDIPVDARKGLYIDLEATFYEPSLGGDNKYQVYIVDYRQYKTVERVGKTLAWQIKTRIAVGDVPYGEMSMLGTPFDLRGYYWGRFRDNNFLFFLFEYRNKFLMDNGDLSKHGIVFWIGSGTVFDYQDVRDNTIYWLPNLGVGYRLEVQPRQNIRIDFGLGRETTGLYFNFNQAF